MSIFALPLLSLAGIGVINLDLPGVAPGKTAPLTPPKKN